MELWKKDVHKLWSIKVEGKIDIVYSLNISSRKILNMIESATIRRNVISKRISMRYFQLIWIHFFAATGNFYEHFQPVVILFFINKLITKVLSRKKLISILID